MMTSVSNSEGTVFTLPSDREVQWMRVFDAPRRLVFEVWTNPKHVPNWMLDPSGWTMPVCEIDLRPGGQWRFVWRKADGSEMTMSGTYTEVVPPEKVVHKEKLGDDWPETINTLVLTEANGKTTATETVLYPSKETLQAALKTGMKEGADQSYERLAAYLTNIQ
jgi:uncharacterized protein YndB with AHSA1/START domain